MSDRAATRGRLRLSALLGAAGLLAAASAAAAPGDLTRVSVTDQGAQATPASSRTAVSGDGRFVAFTSTAQLTAAATAGKRQMYVRDRQAGRTILASASAAGVAANQDVDEGDSFNPFIDLSGDGRFAVFASTADNLVAGDSGATNDVFRKDLVTGEIVLVSVGPGGVRADQSVLGDPAVSYDGSRVAYMSGTARNLFAGDVSNASDVVLRDIAEGTSTLVSVNSDEVQANGTTERPTISADGRVVAFEANQDSTNLFPGDLNAANDIVVRNLATGTTVAASVATNGTALGASKPQISGDGRFVVFDTGAQLDPAVDTNMAQDVYRRDVVGGVTALVSARDGLDAAAAQGGSNAAISADGARVAFESTATDLTASDANNATADVYVRTVAARATARASARSDGGQGANGSGIAAISGNGGVVAFTYDDNLAQPLVPGDANAAEDVFAKELTASDATAPALTVTAPEAGLTTAASQVTVTGTLAADPSGIGALVVGGDALPPVAGPFSHTVQLGALGTSTSITVRAVDGAGNVSEITRGVTRRAAAATRPRATGVSARRSGRVMAVRFRLSGRARVRVEVLRIAATRPRVRLVRAATPVTRVLAAGTRTVRLRLAPVPRGARYRVRVTVVAAAPLRVSAGGAPG